MATLQWIQETYNLPNTSIILWGQSIGAGVASGCLSTHLASTKGPSNIAGLVLETPFVSIRSMLTALYPQRWLPYQYLWPFLKSWWDSEAALRGIAADFRGLNIPVRLVVAEKDELVPLEQADFLTRLCKELGLDVDRKDVRSALHTEAMVKPDGRKALVDFLSELASQEATNVASRGTAGVTEA